MQHKLRLAILAAALALPLAGCSQPFEGSIASRLEEAGLSRGMSECMAERWVKRLSVVQLKKISDLAENLKEERGKLTVGGLIARVRRMDDAEVVEVVTSSTVVCALTG